MLYGLQFPQEKGQLSEVTDIIRRRDFSMRRIHCKEIHCYFWRWESHDRKQCSVELRMNGIWWLARNQGSESHKFKELIPWHGIMSMEEETSSEWKGSPAYIWILALEDLERIMKWCNVQTSNPSDCKIINGYLSCENCSFWNAEIGNQQKQDREFVLIGTKL